MTTRPSYKQPPVSILDCSIERRVCYHSKQSYIQVTNTLMKLFKAWNNHLVFLYSLWNDSYWYGTSWCISSWMSVIYFPSSSCQHQLNPLANWLFPHHMHNLQLSKYTYSVNEPFFSNSTLLNKHSGKLQYNEMTKGWNFLLTPILTSKHTC